MEFDVSSFVVVVVVIFVLTSFIHLDLSFVKGDKPESIFIP